MKKTTRVSAGERLVLTANRLLDGTIVWRDRAGLWVTEIGRAATVEASDLEPFLERTLSCAQADGVVGVYEVVVRGEDVPQPVTVRERIRAYGPTVHPEFAKEPA